MIPWSQGQSIGRNHLEEEHQEKEEETMTILAMNLKIATLQRKFKGVKEKIKHRMKVKKDVAEELEADRNTSDFVWVGGFQGSRKPEPRIQELSSSSKRKLSCSEEDESDDDMEDVLSPATIELQMAWYKNFHIRFFEDEVKIRSPAKRLCHPRVIEDRRCNTISSSTPRDFSNQIRNFRDFFEVPEVPDFKIYDDYHSPASPAPPPSLEYRNLVPGHTPAPPLPPRNTTRPRPPRVFRGHREVRRTLSSGALQNSYFRK